MSEIEEKSLEEQIQDLKKSNAYLTSRLSLYENGDAKLYYSLQRKMTEMSKVFNSQDLSTIDMVSKSDATFERLFKLLEKCEIISKSAESLGAIAGVTGNEVKDINKVKKPFTPEMAADQVGQLAGQNQ